MGAKRIDIVSDTHGYLASGLLHELRGADAIIHAGDITSEEDYERLKAIAPLYAVLGNNDYFYDYGPSVKSTASFSIDGLSFFVSHYREDIPVGKVDVGICGHTHVPSIEQRGNTLVVNPGSASLPRTMRGPTIARMLIGKGRVLSCDLVDIER